MVEEEGDRPKRIITQTEIADLLDQGKRDWKADTTNNLLKALDAAPRIDRNRFTARPHEIAEHMEDTTILEDPSVRRALRKSPGFLPTHITYGLMRKPKT